MGKAAAVTGGGADLRNISRKDAAQIQQVANRYQTVITLVGSRAAGTSNALSDYDFLMVASHRVKNSAKYFLPRGPRTGDGPGIDIFPGPLDPSRPYIVFSPEPANS